MLTLAMKNYFKNPMTDSLLFKAILSVEFKRDENESLANEAIDNIKKVALKNEFTKKELEYKIKKAQDYVYDTEMKDFAKSLRRK
jgi:hypothetical protein